MTTGLWVGVAPGPGMTAICHGLEMLGPGGISGQAVQGEAWGKLAIPQSADKGKTASSTAR